MAITALQKELWAARMLEHLTTMTVASQICDTRLVPMEGGDTWHVVLPDDVTVSNTNDAADITYNLPGDSNVSVTKNFDKYFSLLKLDTNTMQIGDNEWFDAFAQNGIYQLASALDSAVLADYGNYGSTFQEASSAWQFTVNTCADIPKFFAQLRSAIRTAEVDNLGMPYVVGPPGFGEAIDTYSAGRETAYGDAQLLSGGQRAFTFNGFRVFISNNLTTDTSIRGAAGVLGYGRVLGTYATPEMLEDVGRAEGRFGNLIRGRLAAGHKVVRSAALWDVQFNATVVATS